MHNTDTYRAFKNELECSTNCKIVIERYIPICLNSIENLDLEIQKSISSIRDKNFINKLKIQKKEMEFFLSELLLTSPSISNEEARFQFIGNKNDSFLIDI